MIRLLHLKRKFLRKLREKRLLLAELQKRRTALKAELQADLDFCEFRQRFHSAPASWSQTGTALKSAGIIE
jgi:hypothetical protein